MNTYKVLAMLIYKDEKKVVTTNIVKAENKSEAKKKMIERYKRSPNVSEILINEETDVIKLL
ncbi:MAG: hypothetical protein ACPLW6_02960 [Desulfurella sp.]|jgi:hypothetical protein|uniref:Uncharacterized protein n=1 Tax=Desulfurella multipotens TaxID=79269 RepID=A0A1G6N9B3_9BACT|nr:MULTISPECIES: hypothetical protein [Desulfurella]AHF98251.1 hypothetical protein DESACE_09260 [Desulfurella acetivorans A63]HEX13553.1 hypothetical protein [Desulfurella acetivorans]PMP67432.1 MAG: hypothetical protein C0192_03410 [Desulfurella multipotens]PMP90102.1 MAG: hypothetical protein C0173_04830 [Desulfurella sp.]SDC64428.1 hypothetical protein SAMN05660835_01148 [Desulfurella multipotens]